VLNIFVERCLYTLTKYISVMLLELYHITSFQIFIEKADFTRSARGMKSNRRKLVPSCSGGHYNMAYKRLLSFIN